MCTNRDRSGQNPSRALKPATLNEKTGVIPTTALKVAVAVVLTFSISLALYSSLHGPGRPAFFRLPELHSHTLHMEQPNSDSSPTNISHIAFGIGGWTESWDQRVQYWDLWWKPNATRGFVFLEKEPAAKIPSRIQHRVSSDWTKFRQSGGARGVVRMARVVVDLFRAGLPNVRWFVVGDDDTVFFPENLAAVLSKYDHREMVYVGGNSESVEQDMIHAYSMAFSAGGFAVSYPLAARLVSVMDGCLNTYHNYYGSDQRVWACVGELGVDLTREVGFHQIDLRGDLFGLLAAHPLAPLVSLHYHDNMHSFFPEQTPLESLGILMKAYQVDPSRTVQLCFCYHRQHEWSVSVSWGYVVQIYPKMLTAQELETPLQTFKTWRSWSDGPFTFNTRRMIHDPCRQPVVFYLNSVEEKRNGDTLTTYKKHQEHQGNDCGGNYSRALAIQSIVVSAPKMDPQEWKQSRRRHCCEINGNIARGTMKMRIRKCRDTETITI